MSATIDQLNVFVNAYREAHGRVVVLYHANCVDGFYAHILLRKYFNDTSTDDMEHVKDYKLVPYQTSKGNWYIPVAYEETKQLPLELQAMVRGKHVIVADFSFEIPALRLLSGLAKSVLVIDHHKTLHERVSEHNKDTNTDPINMRNLAELNFNASDIRYLMPPPDYKHPGIPEDEQDMYPPFKNTLVVYDPDYCGTMLVGIVFGLVDLSNAGNEILSILDYIQDYDLYNLEHINTRQIQAALHHCMYTHNLGFWDELDNDGKIRYEHELISTGWALIENAEKQLQEYISSASEGLLAEQKFIFVNAPSEFANSIGEKLSNETGLPVAIWITRKDYTKISLRSSKSNGNQDVGAIAGLFGGGGHRNSASFSCPVEDLFLKLCQSLLGYQRNW